ncbi:MAG TPA: methyltransferase domain-containing protein [Candidatus Binatia bacterium]|jgi:transketolase|nr:methyltransferase domain-containing protein [Candidatus Binatia bacterium]
MRTAAIVQCTFSNLLSNDPTLARRAGETGAVDRDASHYVLGPLMADGGFDAIVLAVPDVPANAPFQELAAAWNVRCVAGDEFDVTARLIAAAQAVDADVIVRVLLHRFYVDTALIWRCVRLLQERPADYVNLPTDFNINFGGDVLRTEALVRAHEQITALPDEHERARHLFRPWHWMETHPADFAIVTCDDVPTYPAEQVSAIRDQANWSERSRYGDDFKASEYHVIGDLLAPDDLVCDLACGYGESSEILSRSCWSVVGVDRDPELIGEARRRFGHKPQLEFVCADAEDWVHPGEPFDVVVSMHTLEHVERDRRMLINIRNMLRQNGRLILEVPLATRRPFPVPHNPHHLREYTRVEIERLVVGAGFVLEGARGMSRGIYTDPMLAREAIQLHARKPDTALWVHEPAERILQERAADIRRLTLESIAAAGSGHPGGSLSIAEVLACLYFDDTDPSLRVTWDARTHDRNRVVLSKGHACPAWYAALHLAGILPSPVGQLRKLGSRFPGHPEVGTPGVDTPSGSLGNGLSIGVGMAVGLAHQGFRDRRTYVVLGDGDLNEGATWEAMMYAAHHGLGNLTAVIDANGRQGEASTGAVLDLEPLPRKLEAFGWQALEIHGHDIPSIRRAFRRAAATSDRPTCIVARTVKGRGVSFMEDVQRWHGSLAPTPDELTLALDEIKRTSAAAATQHAGGYYGV